MTFRFSSIALILPLLFLLSGCGVRKKNLLNKLRLNMTKDDVVTKMGQPDEIHCPTIHRNGDVEERWEYNLATVGEGKLNRITGQQICGWLLFWPLLCFPSTWESPYEYHSYLLQFINEHLLRWGKKSDFKV
jgi:hypothetical protein